jgi:hypothetical protein
MGLRLCLYLSIISWHSLPFETCLFCHRARLPARCPVRYAGSPSGDASAISAHAGDAVRFALDGEGQGGGNILIRLNGPTPPRKVEDPRPYRTLRRRGHLGLYPATLLCFTSGAQRGARDPVKRDERSSTARGCGLQTVFSNHKSVHCWFRSKKRSMF